MKIKFLQMKRVLSAALFVLLMVAGLMKMMAQQPNQTKLTEYNFHNLGTIEERVFLLHSIQDNDFFSYRLSDEEGKIDIFVSDGYTCQESNTNSDFDFFLENLYDEWATYSNLDKTERGSLFVEWRYQLEDEVFLAINEDFNRQLRDGNATCDGALPFVVDNGLYQYPAGVNSGNLGSLMPPYYCTGFVRPDGQGSSNCLSTTPNPAFYYMQIEQAGDLNIKMYTTPAHDIDFDCWGPFDDITTACSQLSCSNMVDCSYSINSVEYCHINNAQIGQYYILLITNYSNQTCNISFEDISSYPISISAVVNPEEGGTVEGTGEYDYHSTCTLTAIPNEGYAFYNWTKDGSIVSYEDSYSFSVDRDMVFGANFGLPISFSINATIYPEEGGMVNGGGVYDYGSFCTLTAIPDEGYTFMYWTENGQQVSSDTTYSFIVTADRNLVANFTLPYTITVMANPEEGGSVTGSGEYDYNSICTLTATPNEGYTFMYWTENGQYISSDVTYSFTVTSERNLVANFALPFTITATANPAEGGDVEGSGEYDYGSTCTLTATTNEGYYFLYWTKNGSIVSYDETYFFTVTDNMYFVANFGMPMISATANPEAGGTIIGGGAYLIGQTCTLTAITNEEYDFVNWTENGEEVSANAEYVFTVTSDRQLVANFRSLRHNIRVVVQPEVGGAVSANRNTMGRSSWLFYDDGVYATSIGAGGTIYWGSMFPSSMVNGDFLTKVALYENNYNTNMVTVYIYQGGDTAPETLLYSQNFTPIGGDAFHEITLSNPVIIDSSQNLWIVFSESGTYPANACADTGAPNNRWVSLDGVAWMDVASAGVPGYGWMIRAFIDGEGELMGSYLEGETCTLTATPNEGYVFYNWMEIGEVVNTEPSYSFIVTSDRVLEANFTPSTSHWTAENYQNNMFMVNVVMIDGIEQASPGLELGAFCNGECRGAELPFYEDGHWLYFMSIGGNNGDSITFRLYDHALQQELNLYCFNVIPFEGSGMIGMDDPYEVMFSPLYNISVNISPEEAGTVMGVGDYLLGADVTLTAVANEGYVFINWRDESGEIVSMEETYTFVVTGDRTISALFAEESSVCNITFDLNDSYGDGWTGNYLVLNYEDGSFQKLTLPSGSSATYSLPVIDGSHIALSWISGSWIGECSFTVSYSNGNLIIIGSNLNNSFGFEFDVDCEEMPENSFDITAEINPIESGSVIGTGMYVYGSTCTLTAVPSEGYLFVNWNKNGVVVGYNPTYSFTVTENVDLEAVFMLLEGTLIGENQGTNVYLPSYSYYKYTLSQQIYTPEEIGMAGDITTIAYFNEGGTKTRSYDIYMVHTDKMSFESNTDWIAVSEADRVFSGEVTMDQGYWTTLVLDTSFFYNGYSNLAIIIDDNSGNWTNSPHMACRVYNANGNQALRVYSDNPNYDPSNPSDYIGTLHSVKNQIVLGITPYSVTVPLAQGWNWWSTNVDITLDDLQSALVEALGSTSVIIKSQNNGQTTYNGSRWRGTLNTLDVTQMYKIKVEADGVMTLMGTPLNPAEHSITIQTGANWIGFPNGEGMSFIDAFAGFAVNGDMVISQEGSAAYFNGRWRGNVSTFEPGMGYIYKSNVQADRTFTFPTSTR